MTWRRFYFSPVAGNYGNVNAFYHKLMLRVVNLLRRGKKSWYFRGSGRVGGWWQAGSAEAEVKSRLFSFNMRPSRKVARALRKVSLRARKFRKYTHTQKGMEMRRLQQKRIRRLCLSYRIAWWNLRREEVHTHIKRCQTDFSLGKRSFVGNHSTG